MSVEMIAQPADDFSVHDRAMPLLHRADAALQHDFCPWANRWVYWLKRPFWSIFLAMVLSGICGTFLAVEAFFITGILGIIVSVGVAMPRLAMRGIDLHVTFDLRRGRVGQPVLVRLRIRNRWPWPVWGLSLVRGFALKNSIHTDEGVSLARVPGWCSAEYSWTFIPQIRGLYPLVAPEVETGFPFGLYRATRNATVDGQVVIWPATVMLSGLPDAAEIRESDDHLADRRVGDFGDMLGTRQFRQGDSLRRIHWAQTARQQQLIVCERQAPATSVVRVTADLEAASHPGCDPQGRTVSDTVELVVQVAASVCESLHRQHCRVELLLNQKLYVAGDSAAGFQRLMDALAQATLNESTSSLSRQRSAGSAFGVVVTTPMGLRWRGRQLADQHVIAVSDESTLHQSVPVTGAWLSLRGAADVQTLLPRRWKGACDAR